MSSESSFTPYVRQILKTRKRTNHTASIHRYCMSIERFLTRESKEKRLYVTQKGREFTKNQALVILITPNIRQSKIIPQKSNYAVSGLF